MSTCRYTKSKNFQRKYNSFCSLKLNLHSYGGRVDNYIWDHKMLRFIITKLEKSTCGIGSNLANFKGRQPNWLTMKKAMREESVSLLFRHFPEIIFLRRSQFCSTNRSWTNSPQPSNFRILAGATSTDQSALRPSLNWRTHIETQTTMPRIIWM